MDALDALLKAQDLVAVLGREVPVQLRDISASGCLLESATRLDVGMHASLRVTFEGREYCDDVRVIRCQPAVGGNGYQVGAEFLWTVAPTDGSLRLILPKLQGASLKNEAQPRLRQM